MYVIREFLTADEVSKLLEELNRLREWKEGYTNAGKEHKDNSELQSEVHAKFIAAKIQQHPLATTRLFIKRMTLPRFNKYKAPGQKYARHVDAFKQEGIQTDWSYTLMLQPADKGGELEIEIDGRTSRVALEAGDIVIYPSGNIHQVLPVEGGTRIAAIGWIESLLTDRDKRAILSNMVDVMQRLDGQPEHKESVLQLSFSYHNLLRHWSK